MGLLRKATIVSIGLSMLGAVFDKNSDDSSLTTVAELAMLAKVIGGSDAPAQPGTGNGDKSISKSGDLAAILGREESVIFK